MKNQGYYVDYEVANKYDPAYDLRFYTPEEIQHIQYLERVPAENNPSFHPEYHANSQQRKYQHLILIAIQTLTNRSGGAFPTYSSQSISKLSNL